MNEVEARLISDGAHQGQNKEIARVKKSRGEFLFHKTIELEKFIIEMIKPRIEALKRSQGLKIEHKPTKDPNVMRIELKCNDEVELGKGFEELNVSQIYLSFDLSEKDPFLKQESGLVSIVNEFNIISYNLLKLDDEQFSLRLIGKEGDLRLVTTLVQEYCESQKRLREAKKKLENLQN